MKDRDFVKLEKDLLDAVEMWSQRARVWALDEMEKEQTLHLHAVVLGLVHAGVVLLKCSDSKITAKDYQRVAGWFFATTDPPASRWEA